MSRVRVLPIEATGYAPHALHGESVAWQEKNCYIDVWLEVIHACGLEPAAMLPFVFAIDFEADQWTFFKPPHRDLEALYGFNIQELNPWQTLLVHAERQLGRGTLLFTESDAFHLPDTQATDYRRNHVKTTIVLNDLDVAARRLGYFHNAGYYELSGEDFANTFQLDRPRDPAFMPFYVEFVRLDRLVRRPAGELLTLSRQLLREHLALRPQQNPIRRYAPQFLADVEWLKAEGIGLYHGYAFATLRQLGAAFELGAYHLRWRAGLGESGLQDAIADCENISTTCKALILKVARAVNTRKPADFAPAFDGMAQSWDRLMATLLAMP